jgi:hypothetical protein
MDQNALMKKLRAAWVKECLLLFSAESSVFQFTIQKHKYYDTRNYNDNRT